MDYRFKDENLDANGSMIFNDINELEPTIRQETKHPQRINVVELFAFGF